MIHKLKKTIANNINNFGGWTTKRKIVVIESDDWGSIRMPSRAVFDQLLASGIAVDHCSYCSNDSLESANDLIKLFEILESHKLINGRHPIITANTIVANPDFKKIKNSNYTQYDYELFTSTLDNYYPNENVFELWKLGIKKGVFHPQLHGREHLNVNLWMNYLSNNTSETRFTFNLNMFGISTNITKERRRSYMAALDYQTSEELIKQKEIIKQAQTIFKNIFGFPSKSFIAPNYVWSSEIEETLNEIGIEYIQSAKHQIVPSGAQSKSKYIRHFIGQKNKYNQIYLVRNCSFEPSIDNSKTIVEDCLSQIEAAFRWKKPAIIASHRLNYIGTINPENSNENLVQLDILLSKIIKKWPNVEFMTSDELGELIRYNYE